MYKIVVHLDIVDVKSCVAPNAKKKTDEINLTCMIKNSYPSNVM